MLPKNILKKEIFSFNKFKRTMKKQIKSTFFAQLFISIEYPRENIKVLY
jgi:hypothetical protein